MHRALDSFKLPVDFELIDHLGNPYRLSAQTGVRATVLVFYRGHWCPYCKRYLGKLQNNLQRFKDADAELLAISPEPPATSNALVTQLGLGFRLLCDQEGNVIDQFSVRNKFASSCALLPHAAVVILDHHRLVKYKQVDRNYKKRTTLRTIFQQLQPVIPT